MWRALLSRILPSNGMLPNICTLQRQNCPPTFISRPYSSLLFLAWEDIYVSGGFLCLGRVVLCVEGDSGASFAWLCVYT